jgi:hypothetical protein
MPHYDPGVDSATGRNEHQKYFLTGKGGPVSRAKKLTTFVWQMTWKMEDSTSQNRQGQSTSVTGIALPVDVHIRRHHTGSSSVSLNVVVELSVRKVPGSSLGLETVCRDCLSWPTSLWFISVPSLYISCGNVPHVRTLPSISRCFKFNNHQSTNHSVFHNMNYLNRL